MNIRLAIFDFDGTIADTRGAIVAAKQEMMRTLGLKVLDEAACASTIGLTAKLGFQQLYPTLSDEKLDECVTVYRQIFEEKKETIPPTIFPEVIDTLEWLKKQDILCTIATSRNTPSIHDFLKKLELTSYFPYVLGGNDTELLKPHPEPVLKTLADLSYSAKETLVIGDMPFDIQMGKSAGTYTCGVTYGNATRDQLATVGADYVIDRISQVKELIHT